MMREIVERFRYRLELWRREQRDDWLGRSEAVPVPPDDPAKGRDISHYHDPRNAAIIRERTSQFVVRVAVVFLCGAAILAVIDSLVVTRWPAARRAVDIVILVLIGAWTVVFGVAVVDMGIARRMHREKGRKKI